MAPEIKKLLERLERLGSRLRSKDGKDAKDAAKSTDDDQLPPYTIQADNTQTAFWAGLPGHIAIIRTALQAVAATRPNLAATYGADTLGYYLRAVDDTPVGQDRAAVARVLAESILTVMNRAATLPSCSLDTSWRIIQLYYFDAMSKAVGDAPSECKYYVFEKHGVLRRHLNNLTNFLPQAKRTTVASAFSAALSQLGRVVAMKPQTASGGIGEAYAALIKSMAEEMSRPAQS